MYDKLEAERQGIEHSGFDLQRGPHMTRAVEEIDPEHRAMALPTPWVGTGQTLSYTALCSRDSRPVRAGVLHERVEPK